MTTDQLDVNDLASHAPSRSNHQANNLVRIGDDLSLLTIMQKEASSQPSLYQPGKYWLNKTKNAVNEIEKYGLADFRGFTNTAGMGFTDNVHCDRRSLMGTGLRKPLQYLLQSIFPFRQTYNSQVTLTIEHAKEAIRMRGLLNIRSPKVHELLKKYIMPYSVAGGCVDFFELNGMQISNHYIDLLNTHDEVAKHIDFSNATTFFEIGGGFGVNLHLLIENYKNLRKFIYLDIPPNLYVGTQYLKSFYGQKVKDFSVTKDLKEITFSDDHELEIICIAPWQIERLKTSIDIFYNAHSFVEMPIPIVKNYVDKFKKLPNAQQANIALISYDGFDSHTTPPSELKNLFSGRTFADVEQKLIPFENRKNFIYCSTSK